MKQIDLYALRELADAIDQLRRITSKSTVLIHDESNGILPYIQQFSYLLNNHNIKNLLDTCSQGAKLQDKQAQLEVIEAGGELAQRDLEDIATKVSEIENTFKEEIRALLFVADNEYLGYGDLKTSFRHKELERLPKLTYEHLKNAGKCLSFGLFTPAIALALQAVEVSLRFAHLWHMSCNGRRVSVKRTWGPMVSELKAHISRDLIDDLNILQTKRNVFAHGRGSYNEKFFPEVVGIFLSCMECSHNLLREYRKQTDQAKVLLESHWPPDFDSLVALYLFHWNPELPPIDPHRVNFIENRSQFLEEKVIACKVFEGESSLTSAVYKTMKVQGTYEQVIESLLSATRDLHHSKSTDIGVQSAKDFVTLDQLVDALIDKYKRNKVEVVKEVWNLLDLFLSKCLDQPGLSWNDPELEFNLGDIEAANHYREMRRNRGM
jgi:hypothetical protein